MRPNEVFHSNFHSLRKSIRIVLVRPEQGGNVGSALRALENMGITGEVFIVGSSREKILNAECERMAKHARSRLEKLRFVNSLDTALEGTKGLLSLAATARIGSASRPHPVGVREAVTAAIEKMKQEEVDELAFVFGPESDGLSNEEVACCDWVVTIPASAQYSSLNLAQAILVFAYEANMNLIEAAKPLGRPRPGQRDKLVSHLLQVAEKAGFILPGDPYKMRPRLEYLLTRLPPHIEAVETWHGLLDQVSRSIEKGQADFKGRYRRQVQQLEQEKESGNGL